MGSKNRIAKYILPIMLAERKPDQWWVEPFVGGCNMIDKVDGKRLGSDVNEYLMSLIVALRDGWLPPLDISEKEFKEIRANKDNYPKELVGYAGFQLSYGSAWFSSYRKDSIGKRNYSHEAYRNVAKQAPKLSDIKFRNVSYDKLEIPKNSLIYCDPPYRETSGYGISFDHYSFYEWCLAKHKEGHTVFVSEYSMPPVFECIWEKEIVSSLTKNTGAKKGVERLFTIRNQTKYKKGEV